MSYLHPLYQVVVRAVVKGDATLLPDHAFNGPWECYNYDVKDGQAIARLDTLVEVNAPDRADAIRQAKQQAPALTLPPGAVDITLWVDSEQAEDVLLIG